MTMTNDELRALADALHDASASLNGTHFVAARKSAAYLRAQANAQPVGYATANGLRMLKQDDATVLLYAHDYLIRPDHVALYTRPAPAAPQAEPIDPHMIVAEDRFPDVPAERWKPCPQCGEDVDRECPICDGLGRVLVTDGEQAEPKREPLSDEQIVEAFCRWPLIRNHVEAFKAGVRFAERAHGIGGSNAE